MCGTCAGTPQPRTQQWESSLPECTHTSSIADVMKCSFNVGFWRNEIFSVLQFQRNCFLHLLMCYIQGSIVESPPGELGMLRNIEKEEPTWLIWSLNLSCLFFFAIFRLHYLVLLQWSLLRVIKTIWNWYSFLFFSHAIHSRCDRCHHCLDPKIKYLVAIEFAECFSRLVELTTNNVKRFLEQQLW